MTADLALAEFCGVPSEAVVTARSASAAFLALLLSLELERDAEVVLPVSMCQTMINAVLFAHAVPVLADCGPRFELTAQALSDRLSPRTRLVVFHHPFGRACKVAPVRSLLVDRPAIFLLEDCAQAPGTVFENQTVGGSGDATLFSFGAGKPIDAGVGGALVCGRPALLALVEARLRVGHRGWADDRVLGIDSTLTIAENLHVAGAIQAYPQSARQRVAKVRRALAGGEDVPLGEAIWPVPDVFHRLVIDLGSPIPESLLKHLSDLDAELWQSVSPPTPTYAVPFLRAHYAAAGRSDLWDPDGKTFPVWQARSKQCLLIRTDPGISCDRLSAFLSHVHP